ncbi:hypothetical protein M3A49_31515 [Paraburkholderia sp. CNPSo 3076]|nr:MULTISPECIES: hypothetical protein [unclassified Paraburkholderia]MCP3714969.1 hypothetical protein [Paraburkholderia sp. CNPSo 3281]MCX5543957.1 hypothetical protein [Paraburkholderia sp. CNPSo 3076]
MRSSPRLYEHDLFAYATSVLAPVAGARLTGTAHDKASVLSFVLKGYTTEEVGQALSREGKCARPIFLGYGGLRR